MRKIEVLETVKKEVLNMMTKNSLYTKDDYTKACMDIEHAYLKNDLSKINFFSVGNKKLAKNILIFNLPSIITCACACKNCYTLKAERLYKNTRIQRLKNLFIMLLIQYDANFKKLIKNIFITSIINHGMLLKNPIIRLHESGDMFNKKYFNFWASIFKEVYKLNKKIKFYTYTKKLQLDEIDKINKSFKNFNIVKSIFKIDGKMFLNYGHDDYIKKVSKMLDDKKIKYHICDYGHGNNMACGVNCHACCNNDIVLFYQH